MVCRLVFLQYFDFRLLCAMRSCTRKLLAVYAAELTLAHGDALEGCSSVPCFGVCSCVLLAACPA